MRRLSDTTDVLSKARVAHPALPPEAPISASVGEAKRTESPQYDVHLACEVGFVLTGQYRRLYEGLERKVGPGQMWLCGVSEPHGYQVLRTPTRRVVILFALEFLWQGEGADAPWARLFLSHGPETRNIVLSPSESREARRLALELVKECAERRPYYLAAARLCLKKLLLPVLRHAARTSSEKSMSDLGRVAQVIEMVNEKLPRPIRLRDACKVACLSRSQFWDVFRRATGITFSEFVQRARIARAAHDLLVSDAKIAAVAKQWGYTDESHMHRVFKKFFRCTPSEYRRRGVKG